MGTDPTVLVRPQTMHLVCKYNKIFLVVVLHQPTDLVYMDLLEVWVVLTVPNLHRYLCQGI